MRLKIMDDQNREVCVLDLTKENEEQLRALFGGENKLLRDAPVGSVVNIGEYEFIVLQQDGNYTELVLKDALFENEMFGENNNYNGSNVDNLCDEFADDLAAIVGEENIIVHDVDLTSDDGLKDYGVIQRRASLMTTERYRCYVDILDEYKLNLYQFLATPHSNARHGNASWVKCVCPSGNISNFYCYNIGGGGRPFCILNSDISVSF